MDIIFVIPEAGAVFEVDNAKFTIHGQRVDGRCSVDLAMLLIRVILQNIFCHKFLVTLLTGELTVAVSNLSFQQILLRLVLGQNVR